MKTCSVCLRESDKVAHINLRLWEKSIYVCERCSKKIDAQINGHNLWTNPSLEQLINHKDSIQLDLDRMVEDGWDKRKKDSSLRACYESK